MTALIRHIANLGLLLAFTTLAITGVMSFVLPFSIITARVHIVFGAVTIVLVFMHLATRVSYFTRIAKQSVALSSKKKPQVPRWLVAGVVVVWAGLLAASFYNTQPATGLVDLGHEARHRAEIFRASPRTVYEKVGPTNRVASVSAESGELVIAIQVAYRDTLSKQPAAAIWAQTTGQPGRMVETLFVDEALAYDTDPVWNGKATPRHHILPIWRHAYRDINGIDPTGDTQAVTDATPNHSFSVEQTLATSGGTLIICLEFNAAGDPNEAYPDEHLGQPSVYYTALIDLDSDQRYYLMTKTAHGGGAEMDGQPRYDFDGLTSAQDLVEHVLVRIERPEP